MVNETALKKELNKDTLGQFYKTVGGAEGDKCFYPTRLDTYGKGCYYDCKYCYAKQLLDFRKLWHPNSPATPTMEDIKKVVKDIPKGSVVRMGGMTDCFQPIERIKRNTLKTIMLLNKRRIHYLIVTKSDLIIRPEYLKAMSKKLAHIQVSIPSTDNGVLKFTDNAKTFETRKKVVETLYDNGFDTSVRLAPCLHNAVDFDEINAINCDKILVEFLRVNANTKKELNHLINIAEFTITEGGCKHLPLNKKLDIINKLDYKEVSVCDDVQAHYDYFLENVCHNPNDCCNLSL
ncbi:MAG: radical SAM protein [Alphaproteobacteria bacterium]|nr:radical SAM protein [Alphaproteobacteria bacterium]